MNKKLCFEISEDKDINELEQDFLSYKQLRLKFLTVGDKYTKQEKDVFMDNFYNAKLNTMISIIYYYIKREELSNQNNPFTKLDTKEEIRHYQSKICKVLADLDIDKISEKSNLTKMYYEITQKIKAIKKSNKLFSKDLSFWHDYIEFYEAYNS